MSYLQESSIQTQIGAQQLYQECPDAPYEKFESTGDGRPAFIMYMYTLSCQLTNPLDARSFLSTLSTVVQSGIQVLIWAGDAGRNSLLSITLSDPYSHSSFCLRTQTGFATLLACRLSSPRFNLQNQPNSTRRRWCRTPSTAYSTEHSRLRANSRS